MKMAMFNTYCKALRREVGATCPPDINVVANITQTTRDWQHESYAGHKGWDFSLWNGYEFEKMSVFSIVAGVVSEVYENNDNRGYGVTIDTGQGYVRYMHFSWRSELYVGQQLVEGDLIGYAGGTPNYTPHLHVDGHIYGVGWVDMFDYLAFDKAFPTNYGQPQPNPEPEFVPPTDGAGYPYEMQDGIFVVQTEVGVNARAEPRTDKHINSMYNKGAGAEIPYDRFVIEDGYRWVRSTADGNWYAWATADRSETFGYII